jgi:hypothetical protein
VKVAPSVRDAKVTVVPTPAKVVTPVVHEVQSEPLNEHWGSMSVSVNVITFEALTLVRVTGEVIATLGAVLSTVKVAPELGADVTTFPAKSVPADRATVAVPSPAPTVSAYVYMVLLVFDMAVAAKVLVPEMAMFGAGESTMGSENVAVMVKDVPDLTA